MTRSTSLLLVLAALALPMAAPAKTSDRNQRTNVVAGNSDCSVNEDGPCLLAGGVHITQGTLDIQSATADIKRGGDSGFRSAHLVGAPVKVKQQNDDGGWINATASQVDYNAENDTSIFTGDAVVQQPSRGSISGGCIVYNSRTGQVQSGGAAGGGSVSMTFEPKNKGAAQSGDKDKGKPAQPQPDAKPQDGTAPAPQGKDQP